MCETVDEIHKQLELLHTNLPEDFKGFGSYQELVDGLNQFFNRGKSFFDLFDRVVPDYLFNNNESRFEAGIVLAYAACLESTKLFKQGNFEESNKYFKRAFAYYEEAKTNAENDYYLKEELEKRVEIAKQGGLTKSEKLYGPIKVEIIRLLKEKCPEGGWKNRAVAARAIIDDINDFQEKLEKKRPLSPTNLERTIIKWLSTDEHVKSAFDALKRTAGSK